MTTLINFMEFQSGRRPESILVSKYKVRAMAQGRDPDRDFLGHELLHRIDAKTQFKHILVKEKRRFSAGVRFQEIWIGNVLPNLHPAARP